MRAAAFNRLIADEFTVPLKTVTTYTRLLKEAGLLTTGARGVNAPHMTALDAARITIALLTTDSPSEAVERVRRFGEIKYTPTFRKRIRGYETIQPEEFHANFEGETLEEVLTYLYAMPAKLGIEQTIQSRAGSVFHLRAQPFDVLVELFSDVREDDEIVGERVVPFRGRRFVEGTPEGELPRPLPEWTPIKGGIRVERMITGMSFLQVGIGLMFDDDNNPIKEKGRADG